LSSTELVSLFAILPAALSLLVGWFVWGLSGERFPLPLWRSGFAFAGLLIATVGAFLECHFIVRYANYEASKIWGAMLPVGGPTWFVSIIAALFGKGRVRLSLVIYVLMSLLGIEFIVLLD
jgi:hypothetical protein